jgi:YjbE family integral membrane protein
MGPPSNTFFFDVLSVVLIDVLLAGDNAVVIALAVKSLPPRQRRIGIAVGAGGAVVLRIILTFFASQLLQLQFLKLVGGILILWIAVKLLTDSSDEDTHGTGAHSLRQAIWLILVADITMSVDNILAVAAASKGNLPLLILGLGLSITFVVFTSTLLSKIMDRYPIVIWIGAAILGRVGAEMISSDPWVVAQWHPSELFSIAAQIAAAAAVMLVGWALRRRAAKRWKNSMGPGV